MERVESCKSRSTAEIGEKCRYCEGPMTGLTPLRNGCWACVITMRQIAEAHALGDDYGVDELREARVEQYAATVATGGKLFE